MVRIAGKVQKPMSGKEINEAVARATGEDVRTIAWLGFVMLDPMPTDIEAGSSLANAPSPIDEIDWDDVDLERYLALCG